MNSFTLTAVGHLGKDPELMSKGVKTHTTFYLMGNDYAGKDSHGNAREMVTTLCFVAFDHLDAAITRHARIGDQFIVQAQVRADLWTGKDGERRFDQSFIVQDFRFGAPGKMKREEMTVRRSERERAALQPAV
jgi:single-strand DNA-binding protein